MRNHPFPLAAVVLVAAACASHAAEKPRPAQQNQNQTKEVWTNEDVDQLRSRGLISIVGQEPSHSVPQLETGAPPEQSTFPVYESRLDDPEWYANKAVELQAELDRRTADLQQEQQALSLAKDRITQPGVALDAPSLGVTPEAALQILESRVQEIKDQLDGLADLARQHSIAPGDLRGE